MKRLSYFYPLLMVCSVGLLLGGCVIKPARVPTRHFALAPIPAPEHAPARAQPLAVEVGFVKMPSYLLRDSMVVRKSADEVEYLETALWAERLDHSFLQTLAQNLSMLLASDQARLSASERDRLVRRVSIDVEQFDVDTEGTGTLLAGWRLTAVGADKPTKIGQAHLTRPGPSPRGNPQAIATTLSALLAEFSRELEPALLESARARQ
ncbi:MAG TPA: PqiC family protein [Candidatus Limnocylindrales bacterium]|jgi:uncharacterized lipoprotein YmbA|nr:PqiC family protein [Candidatus Limnocylindrales bacterium]